MRGLRTTIGLVVVLGGLFAYIYFVTWKQPDQAAGPKLDKVFASLEADKIGELRITSESGDTSALKKDKDGWQPRRTGGRGGIGNRRVCALHRRSPSSRSCASSTRSRRTSTTTGSPRPASKSTSRRQATRTTARSSSGRNRPPAATSSRRRRARTRSSSIAAYQEPTFNKTTFDLRDKAALHFDRDKVDRIAIDAGRQGRSSWPRSGNDWNISKPVKTASDFSAVEGLIGRLHVGADEVDRVRQPVARRPQEIRPRQAVGDRDAGPGQRHGRPPDRRQEPRRRRYTRKTPRSLSS